MAEPWRTVLASRSLPPGLARGGRLAALVMLVALVHGLVLEAAKLPTGALAWTSPTPALTVVALAAPVAPHPSPPEARLGPAPKASPKPPAAPRAVAAHGAAQPLSTPSTPPEATPATDLAESLPPTAAGPHPGQASPQWPAQVPAALQLHYLAQRGAAQGRAAINWQPEAGAYELRVTVDVPGTPAIDWLSRGQWGHDGLRPERMVEQQRQRAVRAVNFQRDKGVISFSGSPRSLTLSAQAQDRASWLLQLWGWARALPQPPRSGQTVLLPVASPRGDVDDWQFEVQAPEQREVAGHRVTLIPLVRSPQRPYDLKVTVWITDDPAHWPAGVAWGVEPGGVPLQLWLAEWPSQE